jgi:hypothetical protein
MRVSRTKESVRKKSDLIWHELERDHPEYAQNVVDAAHELAASAKANGGQLHICRSGDRRMPVSTAKSVLCDLECDAVDGGSISIMIGQNPDFGGRNCHYSVAAISPATEQPFWVAVPVTIHGPLEVCSADPELLQFVQATER